MTSGQSANPAMLSILFLVVGAVGVLFAAAYYGQFYGSTKDTGTPEAVVTAFGERMKNVSLLAPPAVVESSMDLEYGPYVEAGTLAAWKADPMHAPGRLTSSPWPERIEVSSGVATDDGYRVDGILVETTSTGSDEAMGYPVVVELNEVNGDWKITSFTRSLPPDLPAGGVVPPATVLTGVYECLPHKNQSGPQTEECAFGLMTDGGLHYALDFSAFSSERGLTIATGERIQVGGAVIPVEALHATDPARNYGIVGVIKVSNLSAL